MKTRKMFVVVLVAMYLITMVAGCANGAATMYDTGVTNEEMYSTYETWESESNIRLVVDISIHNGDMLQEDDFSELQDLELPNNKRKVIQKLQEGIISFFQERYQIDVSEKIRNQEIVMFSSTGFNEGVMGYVEVNNKNILHLNQRLLKDYSDKFETTYIHETLHQIGFQSENVLTLEEGITDALADMICCYIGIEPVLTEFYFESRTLAYQMLAADPEIVSCYLENDDFDIIDRINEKLKDVNQTFRKSGNLAELLESRLDIMLGISQGTVWGFNTDPYWFAFEAQEIVKTYCQVCEPDDSTIDYIRSHYLVIDYETVTIFEDENGYGYYFG